ncbi:hypothetical protein HMPREF9628_00167 [Peptoanaerobacter stomatis]|uniref:Uncharacterized protein n=1 Tax=Peptoanaerobacter stomatis TaxID=796937 RepID=G9XBV9_9FIRM|nr:hypothetical protein [Peptoanaerobacter stomatis]EHL19446.1 hypothetical protein HMPREF9628_00167 [Peptoanaerobacter stomatis]
MNYIELINDFERWLETNYLPISSQLLWYKLIALFNRCGWSEWVTVDNQRLMALMQMKREATFIECRDKLLKAGLFEFQKGKKGQPNKYKINTFKTVVQTVVKSEVYPVVKSEVKTVDINKHKLNETNNISILTNTSSSYLDTVPTHADEIKTDGLAEDVNSEKENMDDVMFNNTKIIYEAIEYLWNSLGLTKIQGINNARKTMLKARFKEYGKDSFDKCIENIKKSSFLRGQNKNGWTITFDWLIRPNNYVKVLENTYADNKTNNENLIQKSYVKTPTMTGKELEDTILANNDLDKF